MQFFLCCLHFVPQGSPLNAASSTVLSKTGGFVWAFHVLSWPEPNEMSGHQSSSAQLEAAHNSNQQECAAIKCVPRATKAPSRHRFQLYCILQDVTDLFNSTLTLPADNSPGSAFGWWSIVTFDDKCVGTGIISKAANIQSASFAIFWTQHLFGH